MAFKHKFEWNKEKKELIEVRTGDELIDQKNQKIDGRFENRTIYPHHTALDMLKELERQMADMVVQIDNQESKLKEAQEKARRVDKAFYEKFQACQSMTTSMSMKADINAAKAQLTDVKGQIEAISKVMGRK